MTAVLVVAVVVLALGWWHERDRSRFWQYRAETYRRLPEVDR